MPVTTYFESEWMVMRQGRLSAFKASMAAVSSMRWLVVAASPPNSSFS